MKKSSKKGFTLIELIVVIAVLALLAVVAVPMISSMVAKAEAAEAAANARTIELAAKAYMADHAKDTITSADLTSILAEYGIDDPIVGSSADYTVASNGAVTYADGDGDIDFE